jgi:hypothetical protein
MPTGIALYCDDDNVGNDGTLIAQDGSSTETSYVRDTSEAPREKCYVCFIADHGRNAPVTAYGAATVAVSNTEPLATPVALTASPERRPDHLGCAACHTWRI